MKIYTKTGDKGMTSLCGGQRVHKTDSRLEAYGTADELNSFVGLLRAEVLPDDIDEQLRWVQNKLFNIGAALAGAEGEWIMNNDIAHLEGWIDEQQAVLPENRSFLLPTGSRAVALSHVCRTITRRLERRVLKCQLECEKSENQNVTILPFLNRLSDYFFVVSRTLCQREGKIGEKWVK